MAAEGDGPDFGCQINPMGAGNREKEVNVFYLIKLRLDGVN